MRDALRARGLSQTFGGVSVLEDVCASLPAGQSVALIGPNGAGKTTLLRILQGVLSPDSGHVEIDGRPISGMPRREIARSISVMRQSSPQIFDFSALELVLMGFHARTARFALPSRAQKAAAAQALERMDVAHLAQRSASVLSGGELQRVLMARTLVSDAPIWLLDEPTANLDLKYQLLLLRHVARHVDAGGSALAILHDLTLAHRFFDRAIVLHRRRVVADGPVDEVLTEARLSAVFDVPLRLTTVDGQPTWTPRHDAAKV